jgi:regulatory protein
MRITALERRPGQKQVKLCLDSGREMPIGLEICIQRGLRVGGELSDSELAELEDQEARRCCLDSALRLLSYRQRSKAELRERLLRKRFAAEIVTETLDRLCSAGLVDDEQFARSWVESRDIRAPRSRLLMASELRARGVARDVVDAAAGTVDERDAAYRAAERRARSLTHLPYDRFRQRVGGLLLRRGFDFEVVADTVNRLWRQTSAGDDLTE